MENTFVKFPLSISAIEDGFIIGMFVMGSLGGL